MEEIDYVLFENYLSGELNKEEQQQFKKLLKEDAIVRKSFETYKDISSYLEQSISKEEQSKAFKENVEIVSDNYFDTEKPQVKTTNFKPWNLAIAASIVMLLGFFVFNQFSTPTYSDYNDFDTISLSERSNDQDLVIAAENAFNSQDFVNAEDAFRKLLEINNGNNEYKLYRAISNIELENYELSEALLEEVLYSKSIYVERAKWIYALSELKQKDYEDCINLCRSISKESEYYNKAQKLIKKLE